MNKSERIQANVKRRVSRNLKRIRLQQGLTFEALGERAGLHWRHVQKVEAGEVNFTLRTICLLANGLGVDPTELVAKRHAR